MSLPSPPEAGHDPEEPPSAEYWNFMFRSRFRAKEADMSRILLYLLLVFAGANSSAQAAREANPALTLQGVNDAQWSSSTTSGPVLLKAQVLLDRAGFSPGTLDARQARILKKPCALSSKRTDSKPRANLIKSRGISSLTRQVIRSCGITRRRPQTWLGRS